jgi:plasmid stabilization system protein ParE
MPQGDKSSYTDKQKRMAEHIEEGYEKRGVSPEESGKRAWATVNKLTGGGRKSGSGRGKNKRIFNAGDPVNPRSKLITTNKTKGKL